MITHNTLLPVNFQISVRSMTGTPKHSHQRSQMHQGKFSVTFVYCYYIIFLKFYSIFLSDWDGNQSSSSHDPSPSSQQPSSDSGIGEEIVACQRLPSRLPWLILGPSQTLYSLRQANPLTCAIRKITGDRNLSKPKHCFCSGEEPKW